MQVDEYSVQEAKFTVLYTMYTVQAAELRLASAAMATPHCLGGVTHVLYKYKIQFQI